LKKHQLILRKVAIRIHFQKVSIHLKKYRFTLRKNSASF